MSVSGLSAPELELYAKAVVFVVSPLTFVALFFVTAPFGKHVDGASRLWGFRMNPTLAWVLMESPNLVAPFLFACGPLSGSVTHAFLVSLFVLHYVHRALIYPFRARLAKPMPFSVFLMSAAWTSLNGVAHGIWLGWYLALPLNWAADWRFLVGVALFFVGLHINWRSDETLRTLRGPGRTGYFIPRGGMYEWISAPNYFGETLEWTGFAIASGGAWVSVAFAVFTFANLFPRALSTHQWYKSKFGDAYPAERKAFFPLLH